MKSLAVTLLVVLLMMLGTVARRTTLCSPTPMVIQGSQASRAPEASEDIGRRVFELDPAMLILMGLPCVASAASAGADRGGEERDHEGGDRDDLQGHLDSRGWGLRAPRYQASAKVWTMTATDHARTFPCGSNIDTRPDERLWHRHRPF